MSSTNQAARPKFPSIRHNGLVRPAKRANGATLTVFQLPEMAEILGLDMGKAKNWTNGRTGLVITPSVRPAGGKGRSALYDLHDLHLMAVATEFSKAGFASRAIGRLADVVKPLLDQPVSRDNVWTISRTSAKGPFRVVSGETAPANGVFWHALKIGDLLHKVDRDVKTFSQKRERQRNGA